MIESINRLIGYITLRSRGRAVKRGMTRGVIEVGDRVWILKGYEHEGCLGVITGVEDGSNYKVRCRVSNREENLVLHRSMLWKIEGAKKGAE